MFTKHGVSLGFHINTLPTVVQWAAEKLVDFDSYHSVYRKLKMFGAYSKFFKTPDGTLRNVVVIPE